MMPTLLSDDSLWLRIRAHERLVGQLEVKMNKLPTAVLHLLYVCMYVVTECEMSVLCKKIMFCRASAAVTYFLLISSRLFSYFQTNLSVMVFAKVFS